MKMPAMIPVTSKNVKSIGYDGKNLFVAFNNGSAYVYEDVPDAVYAKGITAPSANEWLRANVKGKYKYRIIRHATPKPS